MLELDLSTVRASVAGPKRPQDRIELDVLKPTFVYMLQAEAPNGYGKTSEEISRKVKTIVGAEAKADHVEGGGEQAMDPALPATSAARNTSEVSEYEMVNNRPSPDRVDAVAFAEGTPTHVADLHHGDVLIAAITSCTNTSNPSVMLAAGLLAKKAVERGLKVPQVVKTSLAPGSRVVTEYYRKAGLQEYLNRLASNIGASRMVNS